MFKLPAYIRDTYHFLEIIRKLPPLPPDILHMVGGFNVNGSGQSGVF